MRRRDPRSRAGGSVMKLLRALEWEGPAMVEFRVDRETGSCGLHGVNGRYGGDHRFPPRRRRLPSLSLANSAWRTGRHGVW